MISETKLVTLIQAEPDVPAYLLRIDTSSEKAEFLSFEDWSGDHLIASSPWYFVTAEVLTDLMRSNISGFAPHEATEKIKYSEKFRTLSQFEKVPNFYRLDIIGRIDSIPRSLVFQTRNEGTIWTKHDFCLGPKNELILSMNAIETIRLDRIPNARLRSFCLFSLSDLGAA